MSIMLRGEEFEYLAFFSDESHNLPLTTALALFALKLMRIRPNGKDWKRMRTIQTHNHLLSERERIGAEGMKNEILQLLGQNEYVWTENKYPYDGLISPKSNLKHMILWRQPELGSVIGPDTMQQELDSEYATYVAFAFENGTGRKSIQIPHAHAILDLMSKK
jgi:hypothetical protein